MLLQSIRLVYIKIAYYIKIYYSFNPLNLIIEFKSESYLR